MYTSPPPVQRETSTISRLHENVSSHLPLFLSVYNMSPNINGWCGVVWCGVCGGGVCGGGVKQIVRWNIHQ